MIHQTKESLYWEGVQAAFMRYCETQSDADRRRYQIIHSQWEQVFSDYCNGNIAMVEVN